MSLVCDTIPAARLADIDQGLPEKPLAQEQDMVFHHHPESPVHFHDQPANGSPQSQPRKLCARHQRMADGGTNVKLQKSLETLPLEEREAVNAIWSNFSSSSHPRRALILQGLLTMCCFSQLSLISEQLARLIRIDPFVVLPREIGLKILGYLDGTSLCRAAQVSKKWKALADDNVLWKGICEQHIGQLCLKCGVCLPVLKNVRFRSTSPPGQSPQPQSDSSSQKRGPESSSDALHPPRKRRRSIDASLSCHVRAASPTPPAVLTSPSSLLQNDSLPSRRPWKAVYSERMAVERNWRRGQCNTRTLTGHSDGVLCLQFHESLSHLPFPVLISGSYDRTIRVWNMETGEQLHCLQGHTLPVRALQFDDVKLITGSMDCTLKVWDWRKGECIRTLTGHTEGVVCLNYDSDVLASGSVDTTIKVWNLRTGRSFLLQGHSDWVNSVQLWDSNPSRVATPLDTSDFGQTGNNSCQQIDPGKMLFSASDDGSIRLWDLNTRVCVRQFVGHVGQVQSARLLYDERLETEGPDPSSSSSKTTERLEHKNKSVKKQKPILVSGSLDNTVKLWDIETGKTIKTYFGHLEGVWVVASDKMRLVSGSHDRTIKVWERESERCLSTLIGHQGSVGCLAIGEDKIVSGSDDTTIKIWTFSD